MNYLGGKQGADQVSELKDWVNDNERNRVLFERLQNTDYVQGELREYQKYNSHEDWKKINTQLVEPRGKVFRSLWKYAASAIIILVAGMTIWYFASDSDDAKPYAQSIEYGSSKAILFLESGKTIELEIGRDTLYKEVKGENFVNDGKKLVYTDIEEEKKVEWHTLQVPRGGEFILKLGDGTVVTMNADSKIHYPDHFANGVRQVALEGEAFFEVAKDSLKPFIVKTNGIDVQVLGTTFNLKAYSDEDQQTTLVEGKVKVIFNKQEVLLNPGEQLTRVNEVLKVVHVDVEPYIAWKNERFVFDNEPLVGVLKKLERWYNITVFIQNSSLHEMRFTGNLPKYESINKVLQLLELTTNVKFELKERILIVQLE